MELRSGGRDWSGRRRGRLCSALLVLEEEEEEKGNTADGRIRPAARSRIRAMLAPAFRAFNVLGCDRNGALATISS